MFRKKIRFFADAVEELGDVGTPEARRIGTDLFTHWQGAMFMAKTTGNVQPLKAARTFIDGSLRQEGS